MRVLKWLLAVILLLAAVVVGVGFVLPDEAHFERSTVINARPATVFTVLNGFRQFGQWSPWLKYDPNAKVTTEGPLMGVGAKQSWSGNDQVGSGSQEIISSTPYTEIKIDLVFGDFNSKNTATYTLIPEGEGTRLIWSYDTIAGGNIVYRYFGKMLDRMLGADYEDGLARLKAFVETLPRDDFSDLQVELVDTAAMPIAHVPAEAMADQAAPVLGEAYAKIQAFMTANNLKQAARPLAITHEFNEETKLWKFDAAIPLDQPCTAAAEASEIRCGTTYAGKALKVLHKGPYAAMEPTYTRLVTFKNVAGLQDNGDSWEHYISDPADTPEAELVTHIYWPVK